MNPQRANVVLVILLIGLGIALFIPAILGHRAADARTQTNNNLKQMALALHSANDRYRVLPPAFDRYGEVSYPASIHVHLLPYIEQESLYKTFLKEGGGEVNAEVAPYHSPSDYSASKREGTQNLAANLRLFTKKGNNSVCYKDMPALAAVEPGGGLAINRIVDGTSNTIAVATKLARCGQGGSRYAAEPISPWAAFFGQKAARRKPHPSDPQAAYQLTPRGEECLTTPLMAQSFYREGLAVGLADGSVRILNPHFDAGVWNLALHPNDGSILASR
jgi:hypothetical protein